MNKRQLLGLFSTVVIVAGIFIALGLSEQVQKFFSQAFMPPGSYGSGAYAAENYSGNPALASSSPTPTPTPTSLPSNSPSPTAAASTNPSSFTINQPNPVCTNSAPFVNLSWSTSTNVSYYQVYFIDAGNIPAGWQGGLNVSTNTSTVLSAAQDLIPGRTYGFRIKAVGSTPGTEIFSNDGVGSQNSFGWTLFPSCTQSAPPSATPSGSKKPGDTDSDGDIDIFDYNRIITYFGRTDMTNPEAKKADLNNNNQVDIFDYNLVISNFGK